MCPDNIALTTSNMGKICPYCARSEVFMDAASLTPGLNLFNRELAVWLTVAE